MDRAAFELALRAMCFKRDGQVLCQESNVFIRKVSANINCDVSMDILEASYWSIAIPAREEDHDFSFLGSEFERSEPSVAVSSSSIFLDSREDILESRSDLPVEAVPGDETGSRVGRLSSVQLLWEERTAEVR